jgi:hypothetical protein
MTFVFILICSFLIAHLPSPLHWYALGFGELAVVWELCTMADAESLGKDPFEE